MLPDDSAEHCYLCGRYGPSDVHHCIHGTAGRNLADRYGLTVHLCHSCHMRLHDTGWMDRHLEQAAQRAFETDHSHEEWMRIFGKNYL